MNNKLLINVSNLFKPVKILQLIQVFFVMCNRPSYLEWLYENLILLGKF